MRCLYLNNTGSRWIVVDAFGKKEQILIETPEGQILRRTILFDEAFGNFAAIYFYYKGKRLSRLSCQLNNGLFGVRV